MGRQVLPLLASCLGKQAVPYVTQSISSSSRFMTGFVFQIHVASLIHLAFLLHSCVSVSHFCPSQSMMQLFLSAWSVVADLCFITVDTLFCSMVNHLVVMFSTSFLCSSSLVPNVLPVLPIYICGYSSYRGFGTHSLFTIFHFVFLMH